MGVRFRHRHKFRQKFHEKSAQLFNNPFEERKTLAFLNNLIGSKFLSRDPGQILEFADTVLGGKSLVDLARRHRPDMAAGEKFKKYLKGNDANLPGVLKLAGLEIKDFLRDDVAEEIVLRLKKLPARNTHIEPRLLTLGKTFNLSEEEMEIVSFFYLRQSLRLVSDQLESIAEFETVSTFRSHGHILLGVKRGAFLKAMSNGNLFKAQILEKSESDLEISSWCADYLSGLVKADLAHEFFTKENDEPLAVSDFEISQNEMMVLDTLLKGRKRCNILLYGAPGTGKSSFARSLARHYGMELLTVKHPETDTHKDRLRAVYGTVNLADKAGAVVLVDEADEILNSSESMFFKSRTNKSWVNTFLDAHDRKIIWITNRSGEIDPSTMRRFAFSIEFKKLDPAKRLKVLKYEMKKKGLKEDYFSEDELRDLCRSYAVDAGGIVNAVSALTITGRTRKEAALKKIKTVLRSHEKATGAVPGDRGREREFDGYSLEGLNTSQDMNQVVSAARRYAKSEKDDAARKLAVSMLFYGMPGTGKTEFVHYLGHLLEKKVLLKRCSDIQSMWVGQTEKNIAKAFREGRETGDILLFDEADSFLFPRSQAQRSWEKDFTNEILTQLENHSGIVVFATNDMDGLDHAALRRFKFKIEFRPLAPEGNLRLYETVLKGLAAGCLSEEESSLLRAVKNLTPGDFAVVKDQFLLLDPAEITHGMLIDALANEVRYKKVAKGIGFGDC